jgi:phage tail protein X
MCDVRIVVSVLMMVVFSSASADSPAPDSPTFQHEVRAGESISLICIDYYGHYSGMLGEAILRLNPSLKSLNTIVPGQRLTLQMPAEPTGQPESNQTLFEKSITAKQGVVTFVEGSAEITPNGSNVHAALAANTLVYPGDIIKTGSKARVEIIINRESVVRLSENTRLVIQILREPTSKKSATSLGCWGGTVWTKVRKFADNTSRFQLELPTAIAGVHGTVYQTSVAADSSAEVKVYAGEVAVKNRPLAAEETLGPQEVPGPHEVSMEEWTQIVRSMQRIRVGKDGKPGAPEAFTRKTDNSWEQWNEERDNRINAIFQEPPDAR